jgi:SAM-dependent methyltransferase
MKDIFGQALLDFQHKSFDSPLLLHNEYGTPDSIPMERFFNDQGKFSALENFALEQVSGRILDIGAATGRHALYMQNLGHDITAMDISISCGVLLKEIGLKKIIVEDIFEFNGQEFDTILMLMNGIGLAGNIEGLERLLIHFKNILNPAGQLLVDSSDITYLYKDIPLPTNKYFGELSFQYEYKNMMSDLIKWFYIDQKKLMSISNSTGWSCQVIFEDETGAYLARLQIT